ncbi:hypothetical protein AYO38_03955 [bacterium SCGC AG-212-C10]|nr:hypothetical protein AYO38_03955 [bacterium SCGC AG-212-C10]
MPDAAVIAPPRRMTYEEFLADPSEEHAEWVNGEVCPMPSVSDAHNEITAFLLLIMGAHVSTRELGRVFHDPFNMKTGPDLPGRAPDVAFVASANLNRVRGNHLEGPADLVVEVISPGGAGRDRGDKYLEYEAGGVREYWLIDPQRHVAEFYLLGPDGRYELATGYGDEYESRGLPGFRLPIAWLWSPPTGGAMTRYLATL